MHRYLYQRRHVLKKMPQVREYMTRAPHTIPAETTLRGAQTLMREYGIRHLPVKKGNKLVGILSESLLKVALSLPQVDSLLVEDAMIPDPTCVPPDTELDVVAAQMAEEKYGCTLVLEESGQLVGIFTTVDACRALRQVLETNYPG